jgi:hypothetical protein
MEPDPDTSPPLPRVSPREAREATLDPAVRDAAARAARAARLDVLENLRNDPSRVDAFRAAVACAVADGARRVVVLDAGCTGGALAVEAARAGAEQVVAFEPDPILATLVRDTARRVLPPADLRRLAVLEADASRVEACAGAGAAWRVRARDVGDGVVAGARVSRPTVQPATQHTLRSFVATEKADCLVLGAFAVADAVEMADRFQTLARLRDEGVFDALLNIDTHTTRADESQHSHGSFVVIPTKTRLFAQLVTGSNLGDALLVKRLDGCVSRSGDRKSDAAAPALTNACPAAARTRVQARFFEDASLTRVSDAFELTKQAERVPDSGVETNRETNRHDWVPSFAPSLVAGGGGDTFDATHAASFVTTIQTPDSFFSSEKTLAVAAMSWWWMDVGARSMESGDGRADEMRDAVIMSSAPDDAEANRRDRTVTFSPVAAPLALRREGRENFEGRAPCVAARVSLSYTEAGRVAFFVDELLEGTETSETSLCVCACAAHLVWGAERVARWNDVVKATRLKRGISAVLNRPYAGADKGALLDLSDGPRMSVLAASLVESSGERGEGDDTPFRQRKEKEREKKNFCVLCVERDAGSARFARGVARASGFDSDVVKAAAVASAGSATNDLFCLLEDDSLREAVPVLQPWSSNDETSYEKASPPASAGETSPRRARRKKPKQTHFGDSRLTTTVRVGAGAVARDARLAEARADADLVASNAWLTYQRSQTKADIMREKLASTRDGYRAAVLAAMADLALTPEFQTPPPPARARGYGLRNSAASFSPREGPSETYATHDTDPDRSRLSGDDFRVAFDAGYGRRRYADAVFDEEEWHRINARDDLLFAAYCESRASSRTMEHTANRDEEKRTRDEQTERRHEAVTSELERLGLGGIDFDSVDADARVKRAAAVWLALADGAKDADDEALLNLRRARNARQRALDAQHKHMSSLRDAAENALGKTPAWVFLCDPFSFSFSSSRRGFEKTRATRWGDGALAEIIRRRLWARSAGILYVNHLSVPREAVIAVAAVSCPGLRARFEPELEARGGGGAGHEKRADEDDDEEDLATTLLHERLKRLFASSAKSAKREDDENDKAFVPPTPVYLDDFAYSFVSRPAVAARVDLAGDGLDRRSFEWSGGRDAVVEVTGSSVVDALVFWTEYDVGDGGERMTTGPTRLTRSTTSSSGGVHKSQRRLLARDAQGVLFLPTPSRLADGQTQMRFFVETRLVVQTEGSFGDADRTAGYVQARVRSRVR